VRLGQRLLALFVPAVLVSALTGAALMMSSVRGELIEAEQHRLELDTALRRSTLGELRRDVAVYAATPPLRGLMRAMTNDGIDPENGASTELWTERITTIFIEVLRYKPEYVQARVILLTAEGAPEWVRVERQPDGTARARPPDALQDKGNRPYVIEGRIAGEGEVVFSNITLNQEHGRIQVPHLPTLRATSVVRDDQGRDFALVVLNVSMGDVLDKIAEAHEGSKHISVMDNDGHILVHPVPGMAFSHELGTAPSTQDDSLRQSLERAAGPSEVGSWIDYNRGKVHSVRRVSMGGSSERALILVGEQSFDAIDSVITAALRQVALAGGLLALIAAALAVYLTRMTVAPIAALTKAVEDFDPERETIDLPQGLWGEAGDLAAVLQQSFDALERRNRAIAASNIELEQFAYVASHDLQEPLRTITSFTRLLREEYAHTLDAEGNEMMRFILSSCNRMASLIHDLLDYSRLRNEPEAQDVDLGTVLDEVLADLGAAIGDRNAVVEVEPMPTMRLYPQGARVLFQNLLSNALKYQNPGVTPHVRVTFETAPKGNVFRIVDNGVGIAPKNRDKVFRIFQRLHRRDEFEGTGIGLASCARIVALHSGDIWMEDGVEGGISVVVFLKDLP
jgi:signal transduction histidine kinase